MEIYVVTSGPNYEYRIHGVFTDRAKAELLAAATEDSNGVETWTTDKLHPKIERGMRPYQARFLGRWWENDEYRQAEISLCDPEMADKAIAEQNEVEYHDDDFLNMHFWEMKEEYAIEHAETIRQKMAAERNKQ